MTTLIVVRHGQSIGNLEQRFIGHGDAPLTELGQRQAELTAEFLSRYPIQRIYASDLPRAMQTAGPTARRTGLRIQPDRNLREIYAGAWEGMLYADLDRDYTESFRTWKTDVGHGHPEGGETVTELAARVYGEVDRLLAEERGNCIALFTHATPVRVLACRWFDYAVEDAARVPWCSNASVSVVHYADNGSFEVEAYGADEHLGEFSTAFRKGSI